jgi:hypothetical protein
MENPALWQSVFGDDYPSNEAFEEAMKRSYLRKIDAKRGLGIGQQNDLERAHGPWTSVP